MAQVDGEGARAVESSVQVRVEPSQARASERIEGLLDAAASAIDEHGSERLTMQSVAQRAGASIGTIYRYFPDRVALLLALAARNLERLQSRFARVLAQQHDTWLDALEAILDEFVVAYREIPSFRTLRTGDLLDLGPAKVELSTDRIVRAVGAELASQYGLELDEEGEAAMLRAFTLVDAIVCFAFSRDTFGDEQMLRMAREHGILELLKTLEDPRT